MNKLLPNVVNTCLPHLKGILENEDSDMTFGDLHKAATQIGDEFSSARKEFVDQRMC